MRLLVSRFESGRCRSRAGSLVAVLVLVFLVICVSCGADEPENPFGYRMGLLKGDLSAARFIQKVDAVKPALHAPDVLEAAVTAVDNSPGIPPVGDQGNQGSCTAWALAYYHKTHQEWKERGWDVTDPAHQFSPAFVYNHINGGNDQGSYDADGIQMILDHGCATMVDMPYNDSSYTIWPETEAYRDALQYRALDGNYLDISTSSGVNALKQHLANGNTAVIAIHCYANLFLISDYGYNYCLADVTSQNYGSHAVCVVGYDDNRSTRDGAGAFRIVNSWGVGWGDAGYFWMSYKAVMSATTSWQEAAYLTDRIAYSPRLVAEFDIDHGKRGQVIANNGLRLGLGYEWSTNVFSFAWMEYLCEYYGWPYQPRPFPGPIPIDLTDGIDYLQEGRVFMTARDSVSGEFGTIESFSAVLHDDGSIGVSPDVPLEIPDAGEEVMVALYLGGETLTVGPGLQYPTITAALAAADSGDRILVAPGTYSSATGEVFPLVLKRSVGLRPLVADSEVRIVGVSTASVFHASDIPPIGAPEVFGFDISAGGGTLRGGSRFGGGFFLSAASVRAYRCSISGCSADTGGAVHAENASSPEFKACAMSSNTAGYGGAVSSSSSSPSLKSVLIHSNTALHNGGGLYVAGGVAPLLSNCTLADNVAGTSGGAIYQSAGDTSCQNSILWANSAPSDPGIAVTGGGVACAYSCVQGGWSGEGNMSQNPLFVDAGAKDYHLRFDSPCKDAGNPDSAYNDASRPPGIGTARNDMGAYGGPDNRGWLPSQVTVTVGHGQAFNFSTITEAMSCASEGFTILVADGTYSEATGEVFPIVLKRKVVLKRADENTLPVIQGVSSASVFRGEYIRADSGTAVDGFTITGGGGTLSYTYRNGGAFHLSNASPQIRNCVIAGNSLTSGYGGGVYAVQRSSARILNCVLADNYAGGPYGSGGAVYCHGDSNISMEDCVVTDNAATNRGGGICAANYTTTFYTNCLIAGNTCDGDGGGLYAVTSSRPHLMNCTIARNSALTRGGGFHIQYLSELRLTNCIVWGNTAPQQPGINLTINSTGDVSYSCVQDGWDGEGNIASDPLFVNPTSDFHLTAGSPCKNAGTEQGAPDSDLDGWPRPMGSQVDMGAYECFVSSAYSLTEAKRSADWSPVQIQAAVCSAVFPECFYAEDQDRTSGIRVNTGSCLPISDALVDVMGFVRTLSTGEKFIEATVCSFGVSATVGPLSMANRSLGGDDWFYDSATGAGQKGVLDGVGLNNVGLLVTIFGRVTASGAGYFYIDDGSALDDGSGNTGVLVDAGGLAPPSGTYAVVTGISTMRQLGANSVRAIRPRSQSDVLGL